MNRTLGYNDQAKEVSPDGPSIANTVDLLNQRITYMEEVTGRLVDRLSSVLLPDYPQPATQAGAARDGTARSELVAALYDAMQRIERLSVNIEAVTGRFVP